MSTIRVAADGGRAWKRHLCGLFRSPEVALSVTAHSLVQVETTCQTCPSLTV